MFYCKGTTNDSFRTRALYARVSAALREEVRTQSLARCPLFMLLIRCREAWCVRGDMTMISGSRKSSFGPSGVGTLVAACLACATVANAQIEQDLDRCTGKVSVTPDLQISGCTAVIGSKAYARRELTFAFNNRGLAYYAKRIFDRAIADFTEVITTDPNSAPGYNNRALVLAARGDFDRAITDYNQAISVDPSYVFAFQWTRQSLFRLEGIRPRNCRLHKRHQARA